MLGEQASELIHIGLMAIATDCTAEIFGRVCFNFPTLAGLCKTATFDASLRVAKSTAFLVPPAEA